MPKCANFNECNNYVAAYMGKTGGKWICIDCRNKEDPIYQAWIKSGKILSFVTFKDKYGKKIKNCFIKAAAAGHL